MITTQDKLSISTLLLVFSSKIAITWGLTLLETLLLVLLPLLIGYAIDGLLTDKTQPFIILLIVLSLLLTVATLRRVIDTRTYGTMRVALSQSLVERSLDSPVSVINARSLMGRELVDFLEKDVPEAMSALIQVLVTALLLFSFHSTLALSAGIATLLMLVIYAVFAKEFFKVNRSLNAQAERQVSTLES